LGIFIRSLVGLDRQSAESWVGNVAKIYDMKYDFECPGG
jgi:hypothetical protein